MTNALKEKKKKNMDCDEPETNISVSVYSPNLHETWLIKKKTVIHFKTAILAYRSHSIVPTYSSGSCVSIASFNSYLNRTLYWKNK